MTEHWLWNPATPPVIPEPLQGHQLTQAFNREVRQREAFEQYCQWYAATAQQHRDELHRLRNEFNLLRWFRRGRDQSRAATIPKLTPAHPRADGRETSC